MCCPNKTPDKLICAEIHAPNTTYQCERPNYRLHVKGVKGVSYYISERRIMRNSEKKKTRKKKKGKEEENNATPRANDAPQGRPTSRSNPQSTPTKSTPAKQTALYNARHIVFMHDQSRPPISDATVSADYSARHSDDPVQLKSASCLRNPN